MPSEELRWKDLWQKAQEMISRQSYRRLNPSMMQTERTSRCQGPPPKVKHYRVGFENWAFAPEGTLYPKGAKVYEWYEARKVGEGEDRSYKIYHIQMAPGQSQKSPLEELLYSKDYKSVFTPEDTREMLRIKEAELKERGTLDRSAKDTPFYYGRYLPKPLRTQVSRMSLTAPKPGM